MALNFKSVSDGSINPKRLYSFEEVNEEKDKKQNPIPEPIEEIEAFDAAEYWEAINDRDKRIESLYTEKEVLSLEKIEQITKYDLLLKDFEYLKQKIQENDHKYVENCRKHEKIISNLEQKFVEIKDKLEKSTKLIESFEDSNKMLENLVRECKNDGVDVSEETVDFQANLEKNYEQMIMIESASTNIYKESMESLKANYEEKLNDLKRTYEEKLQNQNKDKNIEEFKEKLTKELENMREAADLLRQDKNFFEEKAKSLGYGNLDEALEQNKLLWGEINNLRKIQETYKNENELLHHELDSSIEKFDKKEKDFKEILNEKEQLFESLQMKFEEKIKGFQQEIEEKNNEISQISLKNKEFEEEIKDLKNKVEKEKLALNLVQAKYEESLQKIHKDSESMKKMLQSLKENDKNLSEYLQEITKIKSSKIQHMKILTIIIQKLNSLKIECSETKDFSEKSKNQLFNLLKNNLETQLSSYIETFKRDSQIRIQKYKPDFLSKKGVECKEQLNISRNMTTMESETENQKNSLTSEQRPVNFLNKNEKTLNLRISSSEIHDFSEFIQTKELFLKPTSEKTIQNDDKWTKDLKNLKESFTNLQGEHMKIAEIVDEKMKGSTKARNEYVLFNYFEKLFDRLSLSLQKENEIKSMIHLLDEKFDRNVKEPASQKSEIDSLRSRNLRLTQELKEKNEALNLIENEKNEYKNNCKELQIQLDFKKVQSKYIKENSEITNIKPNIDVSEIYNKYLKGKPMNLKINPRQNEIQAKHLTVTPRTPTTLGKEVNKTITKIIFDNQKTKNGKQGSLNTSLKDSENDKRSNHNY